MKYLAPLFLLLAVALHAADSKTLPAAPSAPAKDDYNAFLTRAITIEGVIDCISIIDRLIDEGEHGVTDDQPDPGMVEGTTKQGLHFEFSATLIKKEAIIYYLTISRGGLELKYNDVAKFAALFADRAGLPHPVNLSEGDKFTFYAQWLIKPSTWKSMRKMMVKVRTENRAEKDPGKAFVIAIERELESRSAAARER